MYRNCNKQNGVCHHHPLPDLGPKCIAQKLNAAIPQLVGDPQTGYVVGRTYDENVRIVRQTAHDINHHTGRMTEESC